MRRFPYGFFVIAVALLALASSSCAQSDENTRKWLYPIERDEQWGFISSAGEVVVRPQFNLASEMHEGFAVVNQDGAFKPPGNYRGGRWGFVDSTGTVSIPLRFTEAEDFKNGFAPVAVRSDSSNTDSTSSNLKWDFINRKGQFAVRPRYIEVEHFHEDRAWALTDSGWGVIDTTGKAVTDFRFGSQHLHFREGLAWTQNRTGGWGIIDRSGEQVRAHNLSLGYISSFYGGFATVRMKDKQLLVLNSRGQIILRPKYDWVTPFRYEGHAIVSREQESPTPRDELMAPSGEIVKVVPYEIRGHGPEIRNELFPISRDSLYGYADSRTWEVSIPPQFAEAKYFKHGRASVKPTTDDYRKSGFWGYVDTTGSYVVGPQFAVANAFRGPLAEVEWPVRSWPYDRRTRWGYINREGKVVWKSETTPENPCYANSDSISLSIDAFRSAFLTRQQKVPKRKIRFSVPDSLSSVEQGRVGLNIYLDSTGAPRKVYPFLVQLIDAEGDRLVDYLELHSRTKLSSPAYPKEVEKHLPWLRKEAKKLRFLHVPKRAVCKWNLVKVLPEIAR